MLTEPILVTLQIADVLESLEIPYLIGGSMATAVHGVARATMDVDVVVELKPDEVQSLLNALGEDFYADDHMIRNALEQGMSFNLIHKETMFKVDIFPLKDRPFDRIQFERRVAITLAEESNQSAYFSSPEDNILAKLYYKGGKRAPDQKKLLKAIETLEKAIKDNPKSENVDKQKYFIAQCYEKLGRTDEAKKYYKNIVDNHKNSSYIIKSKEKLQ